MPTPREGGLWDTLYANRNPYRNPYRYTNAIHITHSHSNATPPAELGVLHQVTIDPATISLEVA